MQAELGELGEFRTDGTWVTWTHYVHEDLDGIPDRMDVYASRSGGSMEPSDWSPEIVAALPFPNYASIGRPILTGGVLGLLASQYEVLLIDLERRRRVTIRVPDGIPGYIWATMLHLGPEYLFLTYSDGHSAMDGMRRYRLAELEGWEPL